MLRRAKRLQSTFNSFCSEYGLNDLTLDQQEWRQIEYLLWITQPFFKFTTALSKTKDVTIHIVFEIYNKLFDHLEKAIRQLRRKKAPWKQLMLTALTAAKDKLSEYYAKTDEMQGDLIAIGTILAPENKLQFFSGNDWDDNWRRRYRQSFDDYFEPYKQRLANTQMSSSAPSSAVARSEINILLKGSKPHRSAQRDELTQYLDSGKWTILSLFYL